MRSIKNRIHVVLLLVAELCQWVLCFLPGRRKVLPSEGFNCAAVWANVRLNPTAKTIRSARLNIFVFPSRFPD